MLPTLGFFGILGSALLGVALGLLAWWVVSALTTDDFQQDVEWRYDVNRMNSLRRTDTIYRLFQPVIHF